MVLYMDVLLTQIFTFCNKIGVQPLASNYFDLKF
jgi:hypothetical protein